MVEIKVNQIDKNIGSLQYTGDWVDVRISAVTNLNENGANVPDIRKSQREYDSLVLLKGDSVKIYHGFALQLPEGYEADLRPRGSLFKKHGLIFSSSGVIDEGYNGDTDEWFSTFYATKDCEVCINERICQFRIQKKQPELEFREVKRLGNKNRGGHGSTGDF